LVRGAGFEPANR